jgi:hypothetical protein
MFPLDPKTVERLARIIVDIDGPYNRTGRELEQLLRHAGWKNHAEYDGSSRIVWLTEQITERSEQRDDIERLLCRICDPLEYDEGPAAAEVFRQVVNEILRPEQLEVSNVAGRPVIAELRADGTTSTHAEPHDLDKRIRQLLSDERSADVLLGRITEARICHRGGAYTMAVIAIGSFVEGLLYTLLTERDEDASNHLFVNQDGDLVKNTRPPLVMLINTAHRNGWIQFDAMKFMHAVRDFRNFIHPRQELIDLPAFDNDSVGLCWTPVHAMLNDLEQYLSALAD